MTDTRPDSFSSKPYDTAGKPGLPGSRAESSANANANGGDAKSADTSFADELASLKETVANLVSSAGASAASTIRDAGQTVATQVGNAASATLDAGSSAASYAGEQAKSLAADLETFARRNPLGAMGGALAIGVFIGMLGRGRH